MSGDERIAYILQLARAMHRYGYSAQRLEEVLGVAAQRLGLTAQFFSTPTSIMAAFGEDADQHTYLVRVEPGETDLGRLADADRVTLQVARGEITPGEGRRALADIAAAPPLYGLGLAMVAQGVSSAAAARFLGGGWTEIAAAAGIGVVTGLLGLATARWATLSRIYEPLATFVATLIATAFAVLVAPLSVFVAVLGGVILLIPGFTLTTALTELATRHLASGTARLSGALLLFLTMIVGVGIGGQVAELIFGPTPPVDLVQLPAWTELVALAIAPLGFMVLLRAQAVDAAWIVVAGWIAFAATRVGGTMLGPELGAFVGALAAGTTAQLFALLRDRPSQVVLVPAVLLLVPGSFGFRSVQALLEREVVSGIETAFTMFLIASGIVAGLLVANVVVPKRRALG